MKLPRNLTTEQLKPFASEYARRKRIGKAGKPKILRPCPKCGAMFGVRELRIHLPKCQV